MVVYQPLTCTTMWGAEYTTALDAIKSICGCDVHDGQMEFIGRKLFSLRSSRHPMHRC